MAHDADTLLVAEPIVEEVTVATTRAATPAWLISAVTHGVILGVFSLVIFIASHGDPETPSVRHRPMAPIPEVDPKNDMDPPERPDEPTINVEVADEGPASPETELELDDLKPQSEEDKEAEVPLGDPNAVSDMMMATDDGFFMAIGVGSNSKGIWGDPNGGGVRRAIGRGLTTHGAEKSVERALRWFKRHQSPDGRWDVDGYQANCADGGRCEPGSENTGMAGDIACTGYALMCFLSHGYDQRMPSRYRDTVRKGVDWLIANQNADGLWGERNYEHAIATLAAADAYGISNDPRLREPVTRAVKIILDRQATETAGGYGLGWDYVQPNPARNDASVSGWNVMALKSAMAAGIDVGNGMAGAKNWLLKSWIAANPNHAKLDPYKDTTSFPYTWDAVTGKVEIGAPGADSHDMAAVGALCAVFLGHKKGDIMLETLCNHIERYQQPKAWPVNTYYLYYDSLALAQCDGERFKRWNSTTRDILVKAQRTEETCFDGSWDFTGTKFHGHQTGRLLSTAYCCLALEASYHYAGATAQREGKEKPKREW